MNSMEDLVGKVCVCSMGRLAVVLGRTTKPWGETCWGVGLDGKGIWFSRAPIVIADSLAEYGERLLRANKQEFGET